MAPPGTAHELFYNPSWKASGQRLTGHRERMEGQHLGEAMGVGGAGEEKQVLMGGLSPYLLNCNKFANDCFFLTNFNALNLEQSCNKKFPYHPERFFRATSLY